MSNFTYNMDHRVSNLTYQAVIYLIRVLDSRFNWVIINCVVREKSEYMKVKIYRIAQYMTKKKYDLHSNIKGYGLRKISYR